MTGAEHHEGKIARHGGISLASRALFLRETGHSDGQIASRLFGEDTIRRRRQVEDMIAEAREQASRCH